MNVLKTIEDLREAVNLLKEHRAQLKWYSLFQRTAIGNHINILETAIESLKSFI